MPDGVDEAPSIELAKLLESSEVSVMSAAEVLQAPKPEEMRLTMPYNPILNREQIQTI